MVQRHMKAGIPAVLLVAAVTSTLGGCGSETTPPSAESGALFDAASPARALGWLGGRAHPTLRAVEVQDPDGSADARRVGGMVVTEVLSAGALFTAGVTRGDVIVRVADEWLPNREDPGADLLRALETQVSSGAATIELGILREGSLASVSLRHDELPLEVGLPGPSERFTHMTRAGLDWLASHQGPDGAFAEVTGGREDAAVSSLAGLAFLAGGAAETGSPWAGALDLCRGRVEAAVDDHASPLDAWSAALATMFLAELAGPLELETTTFTSIGGFVAGGDPGSFEMPDGIPEGAVVFGLDGEDLPPEIAELLSSLDLGEGGGGVQIAFAGGPPGEGHGGTSSSFAPAPTGEPATGPLWTMEQLANLVGGDVADHLGPVTRAVARLLALQGESGGWDPDDGEVGYSDATLATNQALLALGMAERVGVPVETQVLRRALAFVRAHTNDGHVHHVDVPGFDRRREAGRANGAAAALLTLNCSSTDGFLGELIAYGEQHARTIQEASAAVPLHVLNTAVLRRQQGLGPWAVFFDEFRHLIASLQDPDGSFASRSSAGGSPLPIDTLCALSPARTALWTLVTALQSDRLPVLLATAGNPLQSVMTSEAIRHPSPLASLSTSAIPMESGDLEHFLDGRGVDLQRAIREAVEGRDDEDG